MFNNFFKKKNILILLVLYLFVQLLIKLSFSIPAPHSPDLTGEYLFIYQLVNNGELKITDNKKLNIDYKNVFAPRGTAVNDLGEILPLKAFVTNYTYAVNYLFLDDLISISDLYIIMQFILLFIYLLYVYKFLSISKGSMYIGVTVILTLSTIVNIFEAIFFYSVFIFVSFYYLAKWIYSDSRKIDPNLIISSLLISVSIFFRYELAIILIPISLLFLTFFVTKKANITSLVYFLFPIVIIITILISNNVFYGNYLNFGYSFDVQSKKSFEAKNTSVISRISHLLLLYGFQPKAILINFWNYVVALFPFLLFPILFSWKFIKQQLSISILIISICLYLIVYYGSNPSFYNHGKITFESSYVRYFSPIYLFLLVYASNFYINFYEKYFKNRTVFFIIISSLLIILSFVLFYDRSYKIYNSRAHYGEILSKFKEKVPPGSIIFSNYWDKILYKDYQVATISKKTDTLNEYFLNMRLFYLNNKNLNVYYIPRDDKEKMELYKFMSIDKKLSCKEINLFSACKLHIE